MLDAGDADCGEWRVYELGEIRPLIGLSNSEVNATIPPDGWAACFAGLVAGHARSRENPDTLEAPLLDSFLLAKQGVLAGPTCTFLREWRHPSANRGKLTLLAPEQVRGQRSTRATASYVYAATIASLAGARFPSKPANDLQLLQTILTSPLPVGHLGFSPEVARILRGCLLKPPDQRPGLGELADILKRLPKPDLGLVLTGVDLAERCSAVARPWLEWPTLTDREPLT